MSVMDVEKIIEELAVAERVTLLAARDTWSTFPISRLNIPSITTSDGRHGVHGTSFFNGPPGMLLPSATAMGATFDTDLIYNAGELLAAEAKEKKCHVLLAPTVCIQRSPLFGRGFEAFAEDPWLSGNIASAYAKGVQEHGVACSIKHFAAHDQSLMSPEDDVRASERTLRELHLLPFQLAVKKSNPWSFMTGYNKINGVHIPEDPWLINQVLRKDWDWDGLVMSDWFGICSASQALNAGLDLEMPGPSRWREDLLHWAIMGANIQKPALDAAVRNLLKLVNKIQPWKEDAPAEKGNTQKKRDLCRRVASESIVLLKNEANVLPLDAKKKQNGSADLMLHYASRPLEAIIDMVGSENVKTSLGCQAHIFIPLLSSGISVPDSTERGYRVSWYDQDPLANANAEPVASVTTVQAQMYFADNLPKASGVVEIGLCVVGRGRLYINGEEKIDLYTIQPEKTLSTPMFDQASMEVMAELEVEQGRQYEIVAYLQNEAAVMGVGDLNCGGLRIGLCDKVDPTLPLMKLLS
ncbi:hypothetical protein FPRO04_09579 [Fusarium proliferatum]|nr:hypothetical protein FPRO04_09579 [Fusarium proliferatum]